MTRLSTPCPCCDKMENLETIDPTGIHMDRAIQWRCRCKNLRTLEINYYTPQSLVRKAMARDEMVRDAIRERATK